MSTFGSEFKVTKRAVEYVHGLRYNLRMMGILCEDPTFVYGNNQSVLANATVPASTLKNASISIALNSVQEGCLRD